MLNLFGHRLFGKKHMNTAPSRGQGQEGRVPQRAWVELNPHAVVPSPPEEQESRVPEREWVDLETEVDASPLGADPDRRASQSKGGDDPSSIRLAQPAGPHVSARRGPQSAAKPGSRPWRRGAIIAVACASVLLALLGLGVLRSERRRAHDPLVAEQDEKAEATPQPEAKAAWDAACHLNLPRSWKATVSQEEGTPFKSLTASNPSADMSLTTVMRPRDVGAASEQDLAQKLAAQLPEKNTLMESGWLDLPVHHVWREVRSFSVEERELTEVGYFIRKPGFDIQVRARLASLRFPQFRKFLEDIMQSVYCDDPARPPTGEP